MSTTEELRMSKEDYDRREAIKKLVEISVCEPGYEINLNQGPDNLDMIGHEASLSAAEFVRTAIAQFVGIREQAAYSQGYKEALEAAATTMGNISANWVNSFPADQVQSMNCKQYAKVIRSLPIPEAK